MTTAIQAPPVTHAAYGKEEYLDPKQLKIDPKYQRPLDDKRVSAMAKNFNQKLFGRPQVSRRDGSYFVITGQHRVFTARGLDLKTIPCIVYEGLSLEDEAALFVEDAESTKPIAKRDSYRANYTSGDADVRRIERDLQSVGYTGIGLTDKTGLSVIGSIVRVAKQYGNIAETLTFLTDVWGKQAFSARLIQGGSEFLDKYDGKFNRTLFVASLQHFTMKDFEDMAKGAMNKAGSGHTSGAKWMCEYLVSRYNAYVAGNTDDNDPHGIKIKKLK